MRPNGALRWLLTRVSSRDAADAAIGDILEELDERTAAGDPPRWRSVWLRGRLLKAVASGVAVAAPQSLRLASCTIRDAARSLRRAPAHTLFVLGILTAAISAATVTFSVVDAVILKPLPFEHSERLVTISGRDSDRQTSLSREEFLAIRDHVAGLDSLGTVAFQLGRAVRVGASSEYPEVAAASADYLHVLRLRPRLGRFWTADEEARHLPVAVMGFEFWQSHFGGIPDVLGRHISVDNHPYEVVGVMPPGGGRGDSGELVAVWLPTPVLNPPEAGARDAGRFVGATGRLRPGVSPDDLLTQVRAALTPLAIADPSAYKAWHPEVRRWDDTLVGASESWLLLILTTVAVVVLTACVNVANLILTRASERAQDLAIRASLGASRRQLALSVLTESVLIALAAGACALLVASWGIEAIKPQLPRLFRSSTIALDERVFLAALGAALVTGVVAGLAPAWQASHASVVTVLKEAGPTSTGRRRWRTTFLVSQIAGVGVLLVVSALFIGSFLRVTGIDLGFKRSNLLAVQTLTDYQGSVDDVKDRLARIPGVAGVAAVRAMPPLVGPAYGGAYPDTALAPADGRAPSLTADAYAVSSDYFAVTGIAFQSGTGWRDAAIPSNPAVIDALAARALFPGASPIGQRIRAKDLKDQVFTIVGVVPEEHQRGPERSEPSIYYPLTSTHPYWIGFVVRTTVPPDSIVRAVEASLAQIAPESVAESKRPYSGGLGIHVVDDAFRSITATRRFNAALMTGFAIFALFIGAAGIYAVMASIVAQQTKEIGVRVALGATTGDIRRSVLARAGRHVVAGLAIGLPAGWLISRGFASLFFQVTPTDASIYAIVAATLGAVALLSALVPARRAANVDPIVSLRAS